MGKLKGVAELFEGRHFDREATIQIVALYVRWHCHGSRVWQRDRTRATVTV
jgi:hypothetical protein